MKCSLDWKEARQVVHTLSQRHLSRDNHATAQRNLENRANFLIDQNWSVIKAIATALLSKEWEQVKPLKSGSESTTANAAKYMAGEQAVSLLREYGIPAVCDIEGQAFANSAGFLGEFYDRADRY